MMVRHVRPHAPLAVGGPEQRGAHGPVDGGAVRNSRAGVAEDGRAVERYGGKVVAEVGVGGRDADGLAAFQGRAADGRGHASADATGIDLLELEEGLIFLWSRGDGHGDWTRTVSPGLPLV